MRVVVIVVVALLVLSMLLGAATVVRGMVASSGWDWRLVVLVAVAVPAASFFDQTAASLHPFYRRRLSSAFATRRDEAGVAVPYRYSEPTTLTTHGTKVAGFPELVMVATAQVATPTGSTRPVPYTFTGDWVGGAQLGYVRTDALIERAPRSYRGDLTVLGAMAVSGAAFASAMGPMSQPFEVLLALSNARLGAWLPNPWWLQRDDSAARDWTRRRLPGVRSEAYHVREVIGSHPLDDPLLLVTNGGHYNNLGLVEALRHRCATVIVVDSSGDAPPYATTLIDALRLAHDELGVDVELHDPDDLAPGSVVMRGKQPEPLESFLPRYSASAVVTGTITYPEPLPSGRSTGTLVVVKTRLTRDLPYDVLAYANANPGFPHDSAADQWFDRDQFDAYHNLGRHLGDVAVTALEHLREAP